MNIEDAINILEKHNNWRRGKNDNSTNPTSLGIAIDVIVLYYRNKSIKGNKDSDFIKALNKSKANY